MKVRDFEEKEKELSDRLAEKKSLNYRLTNDFFEYKHKVDQNNISLEDQLALARVENEALKAQMDQVIESKNLDGNWSEEAYS